MLFRIAILSLISLWGCSASGTNRRVDGLEKEFRDLRRSHALTSQRIREIDRLNQTTFLIQDSMEQLSLEIEQIRNTVKSFESQLKMVNAALFDVKPGGTPKPAHRPVVATKPRQTKNPVKIKSGGGATDVRSIYQEAYESMQNNKTDRAVAGFNALLEQFSSSDLADNAHYWLGEIYLELGDLNQSSHHFNIIINSYPNGNKVPDALYKLGIMAQTEGKCEQAQAWYRKVREQYPWSPVSEKIGNQTERCSSL